MFISASLAGLCAILTLASASAAAALNKIHSRGEDKPQTYYLSGITYNTYSDPDTDSDTSIDVRYSADPDTKDTCQGYLPHFDPSSSSDLDSGSSDTRVDFVECASRKSYVQLIRDASPEKAQIIWGPVGGPYAKSNFTWTAWGKGAVGAAPVVEGQESFTEEGDLTAVPERDVELDGSVEVPY